MKTNYDDIDVFGAFSIGVVVGLFMMIAILGSVSLLPVQIDHRWKSECEKLWFCSND
jgi:hypothetical protein